MFVCNMFVCCSTQEEADGVVEEERGSCKYFYYDWFELTNEICHFVLCKRGCPLLEVIFYRVCIQEYFRLILCWEVCPLSECLLFRGFTVPDVSVRGWSLNLSRLIV